MRRTRTSALAVAVAGLLAACYATTEGGDHWAELSYRSGWSPCPSNRLCSDTWHVDRATKVVLRTGESGQASRKLNEQEWAQLEKLVSEARRFASRCPAPPTDVFDDLEIVYNDHSRFSRSVTGCAYAQQSNPVKTLKEWLSR